MKQVLLLGDSIRMYYQERVKELLGKDFNVSAPAENCKFSAFTLNSLRFWLSQFPKPDIIHWNNGLWDTAILYKEDGCFTSITEYGNNLRKILRELKKTGAKIIFALSTPVDPKKSMPTFDMSAHFNKDISAYNEVANKIMEENGITVNDLWKVMEGKLNCINQQDFIHPTEEGVEILAKAVAEKIKNIE